MAIEIVEGVCSREIFDRCFNEAWDYISIERQRTGDEKLREGLWSTLNTYRAIQYVQDGYVFAVASYSPQVYNGAQWAWYRYPTYGKTQDGSKSWFYSEEFQQVNADYFRAKGFAGWLVVVNPPSPAATAVKNIWGTYNAHWHRPLEKAPAEVFPAPYAASMPTQSVFVMEIINA